MADPSVDPSVDPLADPSVASGRRTFVARNLTRQTVLGTDIESGDGLWAKFMGLMGRRSLPPDSGLWLPDSNGIHMMFMRFPIDAIFVGKPEGGAGGSRLVVSVHEALPTWRGLVPLVRGAHGVLELPTGTITSTRTLVGDQIALEVPGG